MTLIFTPPIIHLISESEKVQNPAEKREFPRFPITQRCWCESTNVTMYITMLNISRGGIFLKTAIPLPVGQRARVVWKTADDQEIEAEAEVVWCCQGTSLNRDVLATAPGMGLRFIEVRKGRDSLEKLFDSMPAG